MDEVPLLFRQPIVNRACSTVGYSLSLVSEAGEHAPVGGLAALINGPSPEAGLLRRLPTRFAIADCGQVEAEKPSVPARFVLAAKPDGSIEDLPSVVRRWKSAGFGLCLHTREMADWPAGVLEQAGFVRLDADVDTEIFGRLTSWLRKHPAKQIATSLRRRADYEAAAQAGCDLFEGYFFTAASSGGENSARNPSYTNIVALMKLSQDNASMRQLEVVLKRDATLSYKLLRYINSVGFGLSCEIQSFRHAVTMLGYRNLYKWLGLLLVRTARNQSSQALVCASIARGRLAELLGQGLFEAEERDSLFIAGAFSLLPVILQAPLEQLAEQVSLAEAVTDALLRYEGPYGPIVELVELTERLDMPGTAARVADLAMSLGFNHDTLNRAQIEAVVWAEGLGE